MISCLQHYLKNYLTKKVKHSNIFSDACPDQNYNSTMCHFLHTLVKHGKYDGITHYFSTRVHSFLNVTLISLSLKELSVP
jgi:hypothetical protein